MTEKISKTEEFAAEATRTRKPKGSPAMVPFLALSRRKRSEFLRQLAALEERQEALESLADDDGTMSLSDAAAMYEVLADMEDLLRTVAHDREEYNAWVAKASDDQFAALLGWYMERFQPGEAKASRS